VPPLPALPLAPLPWLPPLPCVPPVLSAPLPSSGTSLKLTLESVLQAAALAAPRKNGSQNLACAQRMRIAVDS
jgi:hypothetical protein